MWLNRRRSSSAEDRFEAWIGQRHQEHVLGGEAPVDGPCPKAEFLQDLAHRSKRIALLDPRVDHAAGCPACMSRLLAFRTHARSRRQQLVFAIAIAGCIVIVALVSTTLVRYRKDSQHPATQLAVVPQTVNLWNAGILRSEQPHEPKPVSLSAALIRVTIILPRFSEPGKYAVAVTHDQAGNSVVADGQATSSNHGNREELFVELDLRNVAKGNYFLSTTHAQNQVSYYYPLRIK